MPDSLITKLIRPEILAQQAYPVPDSSGLIKLDAMENPYRWPQALIDEWAEVLKFVPLNRYPHPQAPAVEMQLRRWMGIPGKYGLLLGNGSDELIQLVQMALARPGANVLTLSPTFVMYRMIAGFCGLDYVGVDLAPDFSLDRERTLAAIDEHQPSLIFLARPNNPTGTRLRDEDLRAICEASPGLVVIDEAYMAFSDSDSLPLLDEFTNVLVMRTLSKVGLAGLRLGMLIGAPAWIQEFNKLRLPYNINALTQASVAFALTHAHELEAQTARIRADRESLYRELAQRNGVQVFPSDANFLVIRLRDKNAAGVHSAMIGEGVLVKCLDGSHPLLQNCLRITVGTPEENRAMLAALDTALQD